MEQRKRWFIAALIALPLAHGGCATPKSGDSLSAMKRPEPSFGEKISASFKRGTAKGPSATAAKSGPKESDPIKLSNKPEKPGIDLYLSMAEASERLGNNEEAEKQYQAALEQAPKSAEVLVAYAHSLDRQGRFGEATELYQRAAAAHPKDAAVQNDLGLCYHRQEMLSEAAHALTRAVELQGDRKLYRNNLAAVLVDQGRFDEAYVHLKDAHGDAIAHYNLGYMLSRKGDNSEALRHFQLASAADPTLEPAQQWIAKLASPHGEEAVEVAHRPQRTPPITTQPPASAEQPASSVQPATSLPDSVFKASADLPAAPEPQAQSTVSPQPEVPPQPPAPQTPTAKVIPVQYPQATETPKAVSNVAPPMPSDVQIRTTSPKAQAPPAGPPVARIKLSTDEDEAR